MKQEGHIMTVKEELARAYGLLEKMEIQAKKANVDAIAYALYAMGRAFDTIQEEVTEDAAGNVAEDRPEEAAGSEADGADVHRG